MGTMVSPGCGTKSNEPYLFVTTFFAGIWYPNASWRCRDSIRSAALSALGLYASLAAGDGDLAFHCLIHQTFSFIAHRFL